MDLRHSLSRWLVCAATLAAMVVLYRRWLHVNETTVALTLLLFVLVVAARWPLRYAVVTSVAAAALDNFFFLPPVGTFTINDPQNWLALFAFLVTAVVASRLSSQARSRAAEARASQRELKILFELGSQLLHSPGTTRSLQQSIPPTVAAITGASGAQLFLLEGSGLFHAGEPTAPHSVEELRHLAGSLASSSLSATHIDIPIRSGVRARGLFSLAGVALLPATADALGKLIAVALDRAQVLEEAAREEAALESERLRTLMIDSVTHELRTPLTSIKGAATALLETAPSEDERRELLAIIDEEADRMNHLVAEAVDVARLQAHEVQLHPSRVSVRELLAAAREATAWVEATHVVEVSAPADLVVTADGRLLGKVLINLIENAAKYSPRGTCVTLSAFWQEESVAIEVADRGPGLAPGEAELIFARFFRGAAAGSGVGGTGMGLAISRAILLAHGGALAVTPRPGGGSVFRLSLPWEAMPGAVPAPSAE